MIASVPMTRTTDAMEAVKEAEKALLQAEADLAAKKQVLISVLQDGSDRFELKSAPSNLKRGRPKGATGKSFRQLALEILEEGPLGIKELTEEAISRGWVTKSVKPTDTTYQTLLDMRKRREISLDDGLYSLLQKRK